MSQMIDNPSAGDPAAGMEAAFSDAYERHGRMVFNTCLRILGNAQSAEDATQAVFLVLLSKKQMLNDAGALGGWLHGVAVLAAKAQRRAETRRMHHEQNAQKPEAPDNEAQWSDVREKLDAELDRLPARERDVLVLVYLEGRSYEQAAAQLKLNIGTAASRAGRGLQRLRERLGQRMDEKAFGALILAHSSEATLPAGLSKALATKLSTAASAKGAAAEISQEVLRNMFIGKIKIAGAFVAAILMAVAGVAYVSHSEEKVAPKAPAAPPAAVVQKNDGWSPAVNGLSAKIRLDRATIAPGKRLEAEILLRNTGDKPLMLLLPKQNMLGFDVKNAKGESVPTEGLKQIKSEADPFIADGRVEIQPGQTILWLTRQLEAYFDFVADGEYTVQFSYELKDAGLWNGKASASTKLKVDPDAKNFALEARSRDVSLIAVAPEIRIAEMSGDSSAYEGQAAYLLRGGKFAGRLRISHQKNEGWVLLPVAPLTPKDVAAGDKVRIYEEGYHWGRSFEPLAPGEAMNGLKVIASASKREILPGDEWNVLADLVNASEKAVPVAGTQEELNLRFNEASPPTITMCMGSGIRDDSQPPTNNIAPNGKLRIQEIKGQGIKINGFIGRNMLGLDLKSGVYEFSILCRKSAEQAYQEKLKNVWLGSVESEPIKIKISQEAGGF